jgi:hypothetical protein
MAYKVIIEGVEVICDSAEEVRALVPWTPTPYTKEWTKLFDRLNPIENIINDVRVREPFKVYQPATWPIPNWEPQKITWTGVGPVDPVSITTCSTLNTEGSKDGGS